MKRSLRTGAILAAIIVAAITPEPRFFPNGLPPQDSHQNRVFTFADRVAYQTAIEEVYWRHRIWPKESAGPKPLLDAVMSKAQIQKKVEDYLRSSQALEDYRQQPITAERLQAEMERMAQHTKQPEVLRELFEALGNDPFVIAECLARPVLAQRLVAELNNERRVKLMQVAWLKPRSQLSLARAATQAPATVAAPRANYSLPAILSPSGICTDDTWTPTTVMNAPDGRDGHTAVWTGSEMIIWGGFAGFAGYSNTGGRYNPSTDSWTATSTTNAPTGRASHTAVWTGSEMIVWGGAFFDGSGGHYLNTGGRYNPSTDTWTATSITNAPSARTVHTAVWSGSEMIVWGGTDGMNIFNTGGRYNSSTDTWATTSTTSAPSGRYGHTAVWTGSEMIVWGGGSPDSSIFNTGGRYNPGTDSWTATSTTNAPSARSGHTAVWTGSEMIVWGETNDSTGGRYDPSTDNWTATSTTNTPSGRYGDTAVWTGSEMIV
ncbi:MAG: Kelch repeat-containing protein, partial [Chthoniobacterales bacterium]